MASPRRLEIPEAIKNSVFHFIVEGKVGCHKIYEDDRVLAFLDINPLSQGHTLVIPKEPARTLDELSDESSAAIGRVLPRLCRALIQVTGVRDYNVLENNGFSAHQIVPYIHFHIIPKSSAATGLGIRWPAGSLDMRTGDEMAAEIRQAMGRA